MSIFIETSNSQLVCCSYRALPENKNSRNSATIFHLSKKCILRTGAVHDCASCDLCFRYLLITALAYSIHALFCLFIYFCFSVLICLDLRKHFINEPLSHSVELNAQTSFTCLPPDGYPKPTLFWLKNGEVINVKSNTATLRKNERPSDIIPYNMSVDHSNYLISHDGSLIIKQATFAEEANYTCAVRNAAGVKYSESATLTVYGKARDCLSRYSALT